MSDPLYKMQTPHISAETTTPLMLVDGGSDHSGLGVPPGNVEYAFRYALT